MIFMKSFSRSSLATGPKIRVPLGLLSLLITIIQTYVFRKCINEEKVLAELKENQKKPRKKSGFMARLEEAQRQQQAALREQQKQRNKQQRRR